CRPGLVLGAFLCKLLFLPLTRLLPFGQFRLQLSVRSFAFDRLSQSVHFRKLGEPTAGAARSAGPPETITSARTAAAIFISRRWKAAEVRPTLVLRAARSRTTRKTARRPHKSGP